VTRLYESQGYRVRMRIAASVLVGLIVLGLWYILFQALAAPWAEDGVGPWVLSLAFVTAGLIGLRQLMRSSRDRVIALDADAAGGRAVLWLWRPFGSRRMRTSLSALRNWRADPAMRRTRHVAVLADLDGRPDPLVFLWRPGAEVPDALRRLVPEAAAAFDQVRQTRRPTG